MKLTFCGATREVTGSCYFLETKTKKIVIDCGMYQGRRISEERNLDDFPFNAKTVDTVALTHAHLDHCGRIPKLVKDGFRGKIFATGPTARLSQLIMEDSAHILIKEAEHHNHNPIYTEEDLATTRPLFEEVDYRHPIQLDENVSIEFFDAGHILGSSMVKVSADGESIVFSGDLGNPPVPILNPTDTIGEASYIVMESTYGGRIHEDKDTRTLLLQSAIYETVMMKGVLLIPAFAMERTQELLFEINNLVNNKDIPPVPVFLDSPLAIKATRVFKEFEHYFDKKTKDIIQSGDDVFNFPGLYLTLETNASKAINDYPAPKIIIAGSGMAQGGRIVHHIKRYIGFFANQYLIIGFQVKGSLGRRLLDGEKKVKIHGEEYDVKAKVSAIGGYSAHADKTRLLVWLSEFDQKKLKKVFITHGEESQSFAFQEHAQKVLSAECLVPELYETFDLGVQHE